MSSFQTPLVVDTKSLTEGIDLLSANDHLTHSEVPFIFYTYIKYILVWIIGIVGYLGKCLDKGTDLSRWAKCPLFDGLFQRYSCHLV